MKTITLNFRDTPFLENVEAYEGTFGDRPDEIQNPAFDDQAEEHPTKNPKTIPNTETDQDYMKRMIIKQVLQVTKRYQLGQARKTSRQTVDSNVDAHVID